MDMPRLRDGYVHVLYTANLFIFMQVTVPLIFFLKDWKQAGVHILINHL